MVVEEKHHIPSEEELTVQELNLSGPILRAGSPHYSKYCQWTLNEFVLCRDELKNPAACLKEGREVTNCALSFFRMVKKTCHEEFKQYARCLDQSSSNYEYKHCRNTQGVFDKCMLDKLNLEREEHGLMARAQIHETKRPKPEPEPYPVYDNLPGKPPA